MKCSSFCWSENNNKVSSHRQRWHMQFWVVDTGQCWKYFPDGGGVVGWAFINISCTESDVFTASQASLPPSLLLGQTDILPTNFLIRLLVVVGSRERPCDWWWWWWWCWAGQLTTWPWQGGSQHSTTRHCRRQLTTVGQSVSSQSPALSPVSVRVFSLISSSL